MAEIDFEKIRKDALDETTQHIEKNPYGDMIRLCADMASQVTKNMIEAYHQQLHEDD